MAQNDDTTAAITFLVPGQPQVARSAQPTQPTAGAGLQGTVKASLRVSAQRGAGAPVAVQAVPGEDVVVLHLAGGPALVLHPENARDLLLGQGTSARAAVDAAPPGAVTVPSQLRWGGLEQAAPTRSGGFLGDVALAAFEVLTGYGKPEAVDFVSSRIVAKVDGQVVAGVYPLQRGRLAPFVAAGLQPVRVPAPAAPASQPLLVLIHGTFVDTFSTFGQLWALHPQHVAQLFDFYGDRVYALDHPTVGTSPLGNALTLVAALPQGAVLHLLTHSRGGLVAEALARACASQTSGDDDLAFFADAAVALQRKELQDLVAAVRSKKIRVERIVRVACPARGTLLASQRLDAYLSVLKWTLGLAGVPIAPALIDFLTEVARRRADPSGLPGLASMIPDTPLVRWLNESREPIPGELRVIAGDMQGDSVGSWVKTLLADAYYWTDNDIVVQTRSMYGGSSRLAGATFLLDQGGKVSHFNYFANDRTVQAVVAGLTQAAPAGYATIGPLSWAGEAADGLRAARRGADDGRAAADKPAVFLLPGILGSNLKAGDQRIWLGLRLVGGLDRLAYRPDIADNVAPDGPIGLCYDDLADHLAGSHEVIPWAYDWRKPIEDEARRLADAVDAALDARAASGQPVRLLAHSMGGLLARTMLLERPQTFERLMQRDGARLLMLGTPNGGSWAPMQVLSGDDTFGNALAAFGSPLRDKQARQLMAAMPGFIQLQAGLLDPALGLDRAGTWQKLAADDLASLLQHSWWHRAWRTIDGQPTAEPAYAWGLPPQPVLDKARALRQRLDAQLEPGPQALAPYAAKMLLVVGHAARTPDGYRCGGDGFVYLDAVDGGDGRVPLQSALLPGVRTWTLDCVHGSLPDVRAAFDAYLDLLTSGDTTRLVPLALPALSATARSAGAGTAALLPSMPAVVHVPSRPSRARPSARPAQGELTVFASRPAEFDTPDPTTGPALRVTVLNGNLSFVRQPLMVGHSRSLRLTGTEDVVDKLIGGGMKASLDAGVYPDLPGTHQIFFNIRNDPENPWRAPQPACVVVAGLGDEGSLNERALTLTARQAVIAWVQRMAEQPGGAGTEVELAATLMGSGGVGMNCSNAARAIALGVREANDRIAGKGWPLVGRLTLVELYLERASDAWHGLQVLAVSAPGRFEVAPTIATGIGPLRRQIDSGYRGTDYDFIRATCPSDDNIEFALDTKRARTEVRAQSTQGKLLRELVARSSTASSRDAQLGRTLFQLLVPVEVEPFLAGTSRMLLELDDATAVIPWEMLDTRDDAQLRSDEPPWAIRTQLLRKLRQQNYRQQVQDAGTDDAVLVIGEPKCDPAVYPPLPGARNEALAVVAALAGAGGLDAQHITALIHDVEQGCEYDATSVINALFSRRYRIVHVAGHGEPVHRAADGKLATKGGVVLTDGTFLGSDEIKSMRTVPELVFVNCCYLAARDTAQTLAPSSINRAEFAWGVADSLIEIGVRCVIAAGWAVDDIPAKAFATAFYGEILDRKPFVAAVATARHAAWMADRTSNTWAAYQCYGDPNWTYRRGAQETAPPPVPPSVEFASVASPLGVALALEEVAVKSKYMHEPAPAQIERVGHLEGRFGELYGGMGAVAEAFGVAYAEAGDNDSAITWYDRALRCNDASASLKAHEQLANRRALRAWARVDAATGTAAARPAGAKRALAAARREIGHALADLQALARLQPTMERHSLCASALKRLGMVEDRAGNAAMKRRLFAQARDAYAAAEQLGVDGGLPDLYYPALNRMALELVLALGDAKWPGFEAAATERVRASLQAKAQADPDFWCYADLNWLDLLVAIAGRALGAVRVRQMDDWADLHGRVSGPRMWTSVADQAELVLPAYIAVAQRNEAEAAQALLELLKSYAPQGAADAAVSADN